GKSLNYTSINPPVVVVGLRCRPDQDFSAASVSCIDLSKSIERPLYADPLVILPVPLSNQLHLSNWLPEMQTICDCTTTRTQADSGT
ncbi:MAG: hypothetical protein WCG50_19325, partial [Rhodoferax sp.]|uniref:hypothetical protein n=1 Tax=Rhodoferax sp. TaxID=50421 RepID=UPI003018956A